MDARTRHNAKGYLKFIFQVAFQHEVYAAGAHAVTSYSKAACVRTAHYTPQMSRLLEIHFSGSLLMGQGVGWVGKPNIPQFIVD
ncbi:hypothetical protein EIKCOROL_00540 [Eikenella corrodens ATCC 23834]|uniref:Uncharacterized protein n=1 Tax=Eikenella corrodens ATCC 23834 TaxID=546274 RepID=C0DT63_EIKCO|nr:hypothetical protein [Eikenella corrodens]EEG24768.1 hypothetical protein EIKCOROL_00540 [Eikenella corrodens ATCC 23834]UAK75569.1 hypothetical protein K8P00_03220 [Eikenella corrodens]